jgi:GT2 family glycosyltransferase
MADPELSIIVVSFNTRAITLACLRSVYEQTRKNMFELLVVDNASEDGSADAIAREFPEARLISMDENIGFARANNLAAKDARGRRLLLLNSDTVVLDRAIEKLVDFADEHPAEHIYGGRTLFEDRSLNPSSCWARSTPWSEFCHAIGLTAAYRGSRLFNREAFGRWRRDWVRHVDIVSGCFFLIDRELWERLDGFAPEFFMYGEEADLCLRAHQLGARPIVCPAAEIIHYGGKSERTQAGKLVKLLKSRRLLIERHWSPSWVGFGRLMQRLGVRQRLLMYKVAARLGRRSARERVETYEQVWRLRTEWDQFSDTHRALPGDGPDVEAARE